MRFCREILVEKSKTCAVSGHRWGKEKPSIKVIKETFLKLIEKGYDTFLVGMAVGFDTDCFHILEEIRIKKKIKIVACIPCVKQNKFFRKKNSKEYNRMRTVADERVLVGTRYTTSCMIKRNRFMVERCSAIVIFLRHRYGGTFSTYNYAKKMNVEIINV